MAENVEVEYDAEAVLNFVDRVKIGLAMINDTDEKLGVMMSPVIYKDIIKHFEMEAGPTGKWVQWSESYQNAINKGWARKPGKILQDTGRLRNNFQISSFRRKLGSYEWFNNAQTKDGFPYAAAHDEGGDFLPQRQFMWISQPAMDQCLQICLQFLMQEK